MAIEREPTYQQEPPPSTQWDDVAKLAGKMKSPEANQNPPANETRQKAIDSVLDIIDEVNGKAIDEEEIRRRVAEKTDGLWSRDFAINLYGQCLDKMDPDNPHDNAEADVLQLVHIGMPAELIVENEDFYDSMLRNEYASLPPGALSTFHRVMSATDAGKDRFRQDFIENGYFNVLLSSNIEQIYKNGECDDATMSDLKILGKFGIRVAELAPEYFDPNSWLSLPKHEGPESEKALEYGEKVRKATDQLIQNHLIDGEDYDYTIGRFIETGNIAYGGMMDAMLENNIEPESNNRETNYWVNLSKQSGQNMLKKFVYGSPEERQSEFDFMEEPVMHAFVELERDKTTRGDFTDIMNNHLKSYQTPQFREALRQPMFQDYILKAIEERYQESRTMYTDDRRQFCPTLFYFLAEDRGVLASLNKRDAFKLCPSLGKYENTEKFINGNYTERDRLSLFVEGNYLSPEFFDEEGELNLEFYENQVNLENGGFVKRRRGVTERIGTYLLDPNQKRIYRAFKAIAQNSEAVKYFKKHFKLEQKELSIEKIEALAETINRLQTSNAEEISNHVDDFLVTILSSEDGNPETIQTKLDRIEDVFIHNNLPFFGKVFKTFRVLYPEGKNHRASIELERGAFKGRPEIPLDTDSPPSTLRDFEAIIKSKDSIIFNDLMKASMGSNNRDLRKYLNGLLQGAELVKRVNDGETELSEVEQRTLAEYAEHLKTIYANTQAGKQEKLSLTDDPIEDIRELSKRFSPTSLYSIPDRVVRSFGFMLGIRGCEGMLERMDRVVQEADARNRASARAGNFRLESGDLIKSTGVEYLGQILQNGSVSKEFLNGEQASDSTPLDTDLNVLPVGLSGDISEGVDVKNRIAAFGTMHCMMVMKGDNNSDRNRFVKESNSGAYDPNRYEIWHNSGDNYGIRIGFPSTEIDYFIYDDLDSEKDPYGNLERMKYEIVKNGFYIPIVDKKSGELIFSPEEYDEAKYKMSGLTSLDGGEFVSADSPERNLVSTLALESYTFPDGTTIEGTSETIAKSQDNKKEVEHKREAILSAAIDPVLSQFGLARKDYLDGDLTEGSAEVIDTGSTGRYSNAPGDGDFDFMMKLDRKDSSDVDKLDSIRRAICKELGVGDEAILGGNIRAKNVSLPGLDEPVDVDITFSTKTNKVRYTTDVALKEFYDSMPPEKRQEVVANVVFAKRFLKSIHAYKPDRSDRTQGGFGGVGIENWILQNGGSFLAATRSFMETANECGDDLDAFRGKYAIFDYGQNHQGGGNDNFVVRNLNQVGYDKMREALAEYLAQVDK